jgi:hypothetical protein
LSGEFFLFNFKSLLSLLYLYNQFISIKNIMPRIAGITTKKNDMGKITHVTINMQKHRKAIAPLLQQLGVIEKTQFKKDCEGAITPEELRQNLHKKIKEMWQK